MTTFKKNILRFQNASVSEILYHLKHIVENKFIKIMAALGVFNLNVHAELSANYKDLKLPSFQSLDVNEKTGYFPDRADYCLNTRWAVINDFEKRYRQTFFGSIALKNGEPDIRVVWEPARLQLITTLLFKVVTVSRDKETEEIVVKDLIDWINENPFPYGPHYLSSMECGLRIPVFFYGLKQLTRLTDDEKHKIVTAIYHHAWWVSRRLSLYSSLGNHTICEAVGLVFAGAVFQEEQIGEKWLSKGLTLLEQELKHQVMEDGGPAEQSLNYHRFVLDLYWLVTDFLGKNDLADCRSFIPRLVLGEKFISAFKYNNCSCPRIGDSDDGFAVAPDIFPKREQGIKEDEAVVDITKNVTTFEVSGYTILSKQGVFHLTFDHGQLGMAPLYNHGHADSLSITLAKNGKSFLVDPGTYRYNGAPEWRHYFKSTRAHNTVTIDMQDQAIQETGFIWSHPYQSCLEVCKQVEDGVFLRASHNGYLRLKLPVIHCRSIFWLEKSGAVVVKDRFKGEGTHTFELNLHFHPDVMISPSESWWVAERAGARIYIACNYKFEHFKGGEQPMFGWYSKAYGLKEPCSVLQCGSVRLANEMEFVTIISSRKDINMKNLKDKFYEIEQQITYS